MITPHHRRATILVIQPGALGDTLLSRPALGALRTGYPDHDLVLVAKGEVGRLLQACGEVDVAEPIEGAGLAELLAGQEPSSPDLRDALGRCVLAVCWVPDEDGGLQAAFARAGCPRVRIRRLSTGGFLAVHQTDRYLETIADLVPAALTPMDLSVPHTLADAGHLRLRRAGWAGRGPLVVLHAGSGSAHKCADPGLFASTIAAWQRQEMSPVLLAGPADDEHVDAVVRRCPRPPMVIAGCDLLTIAGLLTHASLYLGYDSGLTHLAAALGVPVIGLYGPTDPERWGLRHPRAKMLTGGRCGCLDWHQVRVCPTRPCLQVPAEILLASAQAQLAESPLHQGLRPGHPCSPL